MAGHVFVCYSSRDRARVEPLVRFAETAGWKCWMAPRDVPPGAEYAQTLVEAIDTCGLMLFVATADADSSPHVRRELERATSRGTTILVARLEDFEFSKSVQYYVRQVQWLELWQRSPEAGLLDLRDALAALSRRGQDPVPRGSGHSAAGGAGGPAGSLALGRFEPERPIVSRPVPVLMWVLLLGFGAWLLAYVLAPAQLEGDVSVDARRASILGARVYVDACARCHGEDANGAPPRVPALRDSTRATAESPYALLSLVVTSRRGSMMPAWGTRLTNEEIVGVVNHVRTSWGHDGRTIQLNHRSPPQGPVRQVPGPDGQPVGEDLGIRHLEEELAKALITKQEDDLAQCCYPKGSRPILFRADGVFAVGMKEVRKAWTEYFVALGRGSVVRLQLIDARYDYDEEQVTPEKIVNGACVIAMGRLFLVTRDDRGREAAAKGRFIRVYQHIGGTWALVFDFADIPMNLGVAPDDAGDGDR